MHKIIKEKLKKNDKTWQELEVLNSGKEGRTREIWLLFKILVQCNPEINLEITNLMATAVNYESITMESYKGTIQTHGE